MRTSNGRVSVEMARKREQVAFDLALKGLTQVQIAEELARQELGQVSHQAVSKMLRRLDQRLLKEMSEQVKNMKVRQTARLERLCLEAQQAWERSKKPQKSLTTKHGPSGDNGQPGPLLESQTSLRDQDGDPRYLDQYRQAMADIRKIWGVDEPARTKNEVDVTGAVEVIEVVVKSREEAAKILALE